MGPSSYSVDRHDPKVARCAAERNFWNPSRTAPGALKVRERLSALQCGRYVGDFSRTFSAVSRFNVGKHTPDGIGANVTVHVNPANRDVISDAPSLFVGVIDPDSLVINSAPNGSPDTSAAPNARVVEGLRDQIYTGTGGGLTPGPKPGTPEFGKEIEAAAPKD